MRRYPTGGAMQLMTGIVFCAGASAGHGQTPPAGQAMPVWNQAYQENTAPDTIAAILAGARNAYVLTDPFQDGLEGDIPGTVAAIKASGNQVAAYVSIGTGEDWRADFAQLRPHLVDRAWGEWAGEYFVAMPNDAVVAVMQARIDRIAAWGFDWVEFDNMDWAEDDANRAAYGFRASAAEGAAYYRALCAHAQSRGLRCMAKSTVDGADMFDGVTYESYPDDRNWWDQAGARRFLAAGKPVIVVHYDETDCAAVLADYRTIYGPGLSFICEDRACGGYRHFGG